MVLGAGFFFCTSSRFSGGAARPRLVSNVSVFSRKRTFRSPQVFESNENWGFGRDCWVSAGLFVRALLASGSELFNGIFVWERPRSALRVEFLSSADRSNFQCLPFFVFHFQISKLPNSVCVSTFCANFVSRSESCEFGTLSSQFRAFGTAPFVGCPSACFRISANGGVYPVHPHPTSHGTTYLICWRAGCE